MKRDSYYRFLQLRIHLARVIRCNCIIIMVKACSAFGCSNRDNPKKEGNRDSFHIFPKDAALRKAWAVATRRQGKREGDIWEPPKFAYLCSRHFKPEDFEKFGLPRKLRHAAIPSVFIFPPREGEKVQPIIRRKTDVVTRDVTSSASDITRIAKSRTSAALHEGPTSKGVVTSEHNYCIPENQMHHLKRKLEKSNCYLQSSRKKLRTVWCARKVDCALIKNILTELDKLNKIMYKQKCSMVHLLR